MTRQKYTGDVAIAVPGNADCQYLNTGHHTGIISKETFEMVQIEMVARSNVEVLEDRTFIRKKKNIARREVLNYDGKLKI